MFSRLIVSFILRAPTPCRARTWTAALLFALALPVLVTGCGRPSESPTPEAPKNAALSAADVEDTFQRLSLQGRGFYESGEPAKAVAVFQQAVALQPTHPDARQNLANALLRANDATAAADQARELLRLNQNLAAAHYLLGAALLRLGQPEPALAELQVSKDMDRTANAVSYLLARAHQDLGHLEESAGLLEEVLQFETNHPAASYSLSQVLNRLNRGDEAARALENHRAILAQRGGASIDQSAVEKCVHTEIRVPFRLEQPSSPGISVTFADATAEFLGDAAPRFSAPLAILDINHNGWNDVFARDGDHQFRLLLNTSGKLLPAPTAVNVASNATYSRVLVGDLNKDRYEDLVVLGDRGLHAFRLATNGAMTDSTAFSNLRNQPAVDGLLTDLDFTGNLDLVLVTATNRSLRVLRNLGNMYFTNATDVSGFPASLQAVTELVADDWNVDELNDFFVGQPDQAPRLFAKARGAAVTNAPPAEAWPAGSVFAVGDVNNDLRNDLLVASANQVVVVLNGLKERLTLPLGDTPVRSLQLLDYDNDGWLDLVAGTATGLRLWRNGGTAGFVETTAAVHAPNFGGPLLSLTAADLDNDGDTDLIAAVEGKGLKVLRNEGGNGQSQLKLRLLGTRSNASGLGLRIELTSGNWRALRTVHQLPIEIGVGKRDKIDSLNVRWFDTMSTDVDTPVKRGEQLALIELIRPTGSCPYLYRWNGERFTFVTDLLGGAPLGLPVAEGRLIEADPDEIVRLGRAAEFPPRAGYHVVQVTEELREVLYLDQAKLLVVDHPAGTEVHPTDKLVPRRPFAPTGLLTLHQRIPLRHAVDLAGTDVTAMLQDEDQRMLSPLQLRAPQQRGQAEPHGVVLEFERLDISRPLVLALTGWLRFGGGMANIAASRDPELGFPFPRLEVQTSRGWQPVEVTVGAPCGKTKTILVDLTGKLPPKASLLRLTMSFEIHWDRIALFEKAPAPEATTVTTLAPDQTDLHWRGYAEFKDLPWTQPLTPDYDRVRSWPDWRITPSGWCTRYGAVDELIRERDGGLALLNGGDELTLSFAADKLPPRPANAERTFFFFSVGWDKDADFHVVQGDRVGPLPWEGLDDQRYGEEPRPAQSGDALNARFNTRWVGPMAQVRK